MDSLRRRTSTVVAWLSRNLNFYRIHLIFFTFVPVIVSIIFWASQTAADKVSFIDALFICVSSMTVTGLATINLSPLSTWRQVILFFLMCIGHPITVSWVIVYVRRSYFRRKFGDVIMQRMRSRAEKDGLSIPDDLQEEVIARTGGTWRYHLNKLFRRGRHSRKSSTNGGGSASTPDSGSDRDKDRTRVGTGGGGNGHDSTSHRLTAHMIRRMDNAPQLVNPSGWISEGHATVSREVTRTEERSPAPTTTKSALKAPGSPRRRAGSLMSDALTTSQGDTHEQHLQLDPMMDERPGPRTGETGYFPRTQTVEFATPAPRLTHHARKSSFAGPNLANTVTVESPDALDDTMGPVRRSLSRPDLDRRTVGSRSYVDMARSNTVMSNRTRGGTTTMWDPAPVRSQDSGFGGFPGPIDIVTRGIRRLLPTSIEQKVTQAVTLPRTETLISQALNRTDQPGNAARTVPYLRFDTVVGRNSMFHDLTQEKLEELGGVEYRALTALLWIVGAYQIIFPVIVFIIIAPYVSRPEWRHVFNDQLGYVSPAWFSAFQSVSAYTNTGTSLVDASMAPFQTAYAMILPMFVVIIAGNTGYPIVLRLVIWILTKIVPKRSQANETLHFLLDHPRRCYIYLFPSHQTWFLFTVLMAMVLTDWVCFLVLDLGTPEILAIPIGTRFVVGLLQAGAVRAAGFAAIPLNALAPAVKILYITMMYVAVYPIALSVRSTNVYEEKSLGIFEAENQEDELEPEDVTSGSRASLWSRYLFMHARKQLSFDIWWLGFALWLLCIIERGPLTDLAKQNWFNIFSVLFELVSAYGTVGLSLGIPDQNYSFSGSLTTLSKFIIIVVMLRGRHRGLPVAIDRAVLMRGDDFPNSLDRGDDDHGQVSMQRFDTTTEDRHRGRTGEPKGVRSFDEKSAVSNGHSMLSGLAQPTALAAYLMATPPAKEDPEGAAAAAAATAARQSPDRTRLRTVHEASAVPRNRAATVTSDGRDASRPRRVFDL